MCYKVYKEVWEMMDSPFYNLGVLTWYIDTVIKSKSCCGNKGRWRPLLWLGMDTLIVNRKSEIGKYSSHGERKLCGHVFLLEKLLLSQTGFHLSK